MRDISKFFLYVRDMFYTVRTKSKHSRMFINVKHVADALCSYDHSRKNCSLGKVH